MDAVFGTQNFVNEIVWKRTSAHSDYVQGAKHFGRIHDTILFYCKDSDRPWNPVFMPYDEDYVERIYRYKDPDGRRYQTQPLHAAKPGGDTLYEWKGHHPPPGRYWAFSKENMQKLDDEGRVYYSRTGVPRYKIYLDESKGVAAQDMWTDITPVHNLPSERLGYPTQKPVALLERIILSSSNEGDIILDPFCGCGTAIHAAQKLNRHWIGIDITHLAIGLIEYRLRDAFGIRPKVIGAPEDLAGAHDLFERNPFQFEAWAVTRLLGIKPNERQTGDRGIDGVGRFYLGRGKDGKKQYGKVFVSVKGGKRLNVGMIRDFRGAMERDRIDLGIFICLHKPTNGMVTEAASAGRYRDLNGHDFPRIQIYTIEEFFNGQKPKLPPTIEQAHRSAAAESGEQHTLI